MTATNWSGRKVLVTGADGFIGSHLAAALVERGADVRALCLYNSFDSHGWLDDLDGPVRAALEVVRGDIRDGAQMMRVCAGRDTVFHLAALISVPFSYEAPASFVATNVAGTCNLLSASLAANVSAFVHTSTSEVYGTARTKPISESHPLNAQSPYAASKIGADMMARSFAATYDMPVVVLRPFNTYGPRQSERAVIPTAIRQFLDPACEVVRLGDLSPARDFTFVSDTAAAFLSVAALAESHAGETFNAGTGHMVTIGEMVETVRRLAGSAKTIACEAERKRPANSEVFELQADWQALNRSAGWAPQIALADGLDRTIRWWRARLDRLRPDARYMT